MELSSRKKVLRYLCGTINEAIHYKRMKDSSLMATVIVIGAEVLMIAEALSAILSILVRVQSH